MKHRASNLVGLVALIAPLAVAAVGGLPAPLGVPQAHAQPSDAATALAREKFLEGVTAYDAGRFEDARSLFLQSYAITRHPAVLLNLGLAELKTGHNTDAGMHLQQFLREHRSAPEAQKQAARVGISDAQKRTGHIVVIVDVDGAKVAVDDAVVGTSPLLDLVFVEPGEHTVTATMSGRTARAKVNAARGTAAAANLSLKALGVSAPPAAAPPTVPSTGPAATTAPPSTTAPATTGYPPPTTDYGAPAPPPTSGPTGFGAPVTPDDTSGGHRNFFDWYTDKPVAWVFTGVAGAGLVIAVVGGILWGNAESAIDDQTQYILDEVERNSGNPSSDGYLTANWYSDGEPKPCGPEDKPGLDHPYYHTNCDVLRDNIDARDTDVAVTAVGLVAFGVGLAGTLIYYAVDGSEPSADQSASKVRLVGIAPVVTPTDRGFALAGTF